MTSWRLRRSGLLIPEMIAYASLAGLPAQAGLHTLLAGPG